MDSKEEHKQYWRKNITAVIILMIIWFVVGLGSGILWVDQLNEITSFPFGGFKFGFWMAQQGSIVSFVLLVLTYAFLMERMDKKYHVEESETQSEGGDHA